MLGSSFDLPFPPIHQASLERFELAWRGSDVPDLNEFLLCKPDSLDVLPRFFGELIKIDLEFRWRGVNGASRLYVEDYLEANPGIHPRTEIPLHLIAEEYLVRQRWGDKPPHQEYLVRFPSQAILLSGALSRIDAILQAEFHGQEESLLDKSEVSTVPFGRLGRYELRDILGCGAFGTVFHGWDTSLRQSVAVKVLHGNRSLCPIERERFFREARATANCKHPGIVTVRNVDEDGHSVYIVADLVVGTSLAHWIKDHALSPTAAASLLATVCDAVEFAHQEGIVHRDLKPSNILLKQPDLIRTTSLQKLVPLVTDFGLAKQSSEDLTVTMQGHLLGTPAYMSPEQMEDAHSVDRRADVYSLGVILYELLTSRVPFAGTWTTILRQVRSEDPRPVRQMNDNVPPDLEVITLKCLEKEPVQRYQTAAELGADLRRFLAGEPILARPATRIEVLGKLLRRHPTLAAILVGTICTGALSVSFLVAFAWQANQNWRHEQLAAQELLKEKQQTELALQHERLTSYFHTITAANLERRANHFSLAYSLLTECPPEYRHWEWRFLNRACRGDSLTMRGHVGGVLALAISPDGAKLLSGGQDATVRLWESETGQELGCLAGHSKPVRAVAFDQTGAYLASGGDDKVVRIWDAKTRREIRALAGHQQPITSLVFTPDGKQLISGSQDKTIKLWRADTGELIASLTGHSAHVFSVAVNPSGTQLSSGGDDRSIRIWDLTTLKEVRVLEDHRRGVLHVTFSPNGAYMASGAKDGALRIWDVKAGYKSVTAIQHATWVPGAAFSPDGKSIASIADDECLRIWNVKTGRLIEALRGQDRVGCLCFSPKGRFGFTAGGDETIRSWDILNSSYVRSIPQGALIQCLGFGADGSVIASGDHDGKVFLRDPVSGQHMHTFVFKYPITGLSFSPTKPILAIAEENRNVSLCDVKTRQVVGVCPVESGARRIGFCSDGTELVVCRGDFRIGVYDVISGSMKFSHLIHTGAINDLAVQVAARLIATASDDKTVCLFDVVGHNEIRRFNHDEAVYSVAISHDASFVAAGTTSGWIHLWDVQAGKLVRRIRVNSRAVRSLSFSPDDCRLTTGSGDGSVKMWDIPSGRSAITLEGMQDDVTCVAFSPDGRLVAAGSDDRSLRIWNSTSLRPDSSEQP